MVGSQRRGKGEEMDALTALDAQRLASDSGGRKTSPRRRRSRNRVRNRRFALGEMDSIDDKMFKRMFRMSKHAFSNLLGLLEDHYEERDSASVRQAKNSSGSVVSPKTALAVTLRWLAGASYIDLCFTWGISMGSFFVDGGVLWGTMEVHYCFYYTLRYVLFITF